MSRYLPSLSTLISLGNLPENLDFLQNAVDSVFDDIYFDHYQVISSKYGEEKTYNLDIILDKHLGFKIPGTGMSLLLNPGENNQNRTGAKTCASRSTIATYLRLQLEEYHDIDAITNQLPDTVEESNTGFYTEGLFAFHMEGLPEYQEPIN